MYEPIKQMPHLHVIEGENDLSGKHKDTNSQTHPQLAALFLDHLPMLYHVDGTLVDRVVCFVSQPVFISLTESEMLRSHVKSNKTKPSDSQL